MATFETSDHVTEELNKGMDVWSIFSPLSGYVPKDSLNLGQGFMNWTPPAFAQKAAEEALHTVQTNHYAHARGLASLRKALKGYLEKDGSFGRELDPESEILVTAGANEGMYAACKAFLREGDEAVVIEPFFDQYIAQIKFNGGTPVYVPLHPPKEAETSNVAAADWKIDFAELEASFTAKTKILFINTPHNPSGKVFSKDELLAIGRLAKKHNLLILSDEVYDCLTFQPELPHVRIAGLEDFWERTITIGSAGKSFSATGWRVGWLIGPKELIRPTLAASTRIVFCVNSPLQEAVARGLVESEKEQFFETQRKEYAERLAVIREKLDLLGLPYTIPEGSYFILINTKKLKIPADFVVPDMLKDKARDYKCAWFVAQTAGVVTIPPTDFYCREHWGIGEDYIRLAFCKDPQTLRDAGDRLLKLKEYIE